MKRIVVCGAGGFIGGHLAVRLKQHGHWVRGVDIKHHQFSQLPVDEFLVKDLRDYENCLQAVDGMDEVYQLAADMGGMGYIHKAECAIMRNNSLINSNMVQASVDAYVSKYFFSSSVCVYRNMLPGEPTLEEADAYPALPDNEYGWEKLYAERMALAYARHYPLIVRIGRFQNCYGPYGAWEGGREKAPAALCRKAILSDSHLDVWGMGNAIRSYTYIDDTVDGILAVMGSGIRQPVNIGSENLVTVDQLAHTVIEISGKPLKIRYIEGPVGVLSRNFSKKTIKSLGWEPKVDLHTGIERTYRWIQDQIQNQNYSV